MLEQTCERIEGIEPWLHGAWRVRPVGWYRLCSLHLRSLKAITNTAECRIDLPQRAGRGLTGAAVGEAVTLEGVGKTGRAVIIAELVVHDRLDALPPLRALLRGVNHIAQTLLGGEQLGLAFVGHLANDRGGAGK